jgi:hypothetical protein
VVPAEKINSGDKVRGGLVVGARQKSVFRYPQIRDQMLFILFRLNKTLFWLNTLRFVAINQTFSPLNFFAQ